MANYLNSFKGFAMQLQLYGKKIWVYQQPVDFRCSIDGLVGIITAELKHDPQTGIYLFYNRWHDKIKCISWHRKYGIIGGIRQNFEIL